MGYISALTYYLLLLIKNLFKSKKTAYNKRRATKIVADRELKVVVSRTEPVRIAFDWREYKECRQWTWENSTLKISYPCHLL